MKKLFIGVALLACLASGVWGQFDTFGAFDSKTKITQILSDSLATAVIDSGNVPAGALSVTDIGNGGNGFVNKTAVDDSVDAGLARADSSKITDGKLAVSDINQLSTLIGLRLLGSSFADSLFSHTGKEWLVPLPDACDTTASAEDSTTVKLFSNIDGAKGQKKLFYVYGNASTAVDSTIWATTFYPRDIKPDSLYFYASTTDSSLTSYSVSIWDKDGNRVFSSGNITFTNSNVFERKVFAATAFATLDEHAIVYRVRVTTAATSVKIGQVYFKRN